MKGIFYIALLTLGLFTISCKKKAETSSASGGGTGSSSSGYYGILEFSKSESVSSGTLTSGYTYASAYFSTSPTTNKDFSKYTKVTSVSVNGVTYKFNTFDYQDSTSTTPTFPTSWLVNGLGSIPSFSYTNNSPLPTFPNYGSLPDTIYKGQTNTLNISGVTNTGLVSVNISDASAHVYALEATAGAATVSLDASGLSSLSPGNSCYLSIVCSKDNVQTFSGKNFNFPIRYTINKQIVIK